MAAGLARHLAFFLPERRLVLRLVLVERRPVVALALTVKEKARRVVAEDALRALNQVDAVVRARRADVVLQHDGAPAGSLYHAGVVIAAPIDLFPLRVACRHMIFAVGFQAEMRRTHRHQIIEAVAAIDVHVVSDRAEAMRRVEVGVAPRVMRSPP